MAYAVGDMRVQVTGTLPGPEIWSNTWSVNTSGAADAQDIANIFNAFYEDITGFASWLSISYSATRCVVKDLDTGLPFEAAWTPRTGSSTATILPHQMAMRVSLTANTVNGGPFLNGFVVTAVDAGGDIEQALIDDFIGALETLGDSLTAADCVLCIDRPTVSQLAPVTRGRVGNRFDVIRKRANDVPDIYTVFDHN